MIPYSDPNLHNPAFIHAYLALMCFCLAAVIVAVWMEFRTGDKK